MTKYPAIFIAFSITCLSCAVLGNNKHKQIPKPDMVYVNGGSFTMGNIYGDDNEDAKPTHTVELNDYRIGKYEVTYNEYDAFAQQTGTDLPKSESINRGKRAVVYVNWEEAQAFCNFHGWRLPTEQEWEYAARGEGKKMKFAGTNHIDSLSNYARFQSNSAPYSFRVGSKRPNSIGLHDMSGNVLEWIGPFYQLYPKKGKAPNWDNLEKRGIRILRGGSFRESKKISATYWRVGMLKEAQEYDVGFRCVDPLKNDYSGKSN